MLRFFFNRFSKAVYAMEILGVVFTALWAFQNPPAIPFGIYLSLYLFLRFCAAWRWHRQARRYEGIELQFKKAMIPTSYLMALTSGVGYFTGSSLLLWPSILLIGTIAHVNVILIYLHFKDRNKTPINCFSANKYITLPHSPSPSREGAGGGAQ